MYYADIHIHALSGVDDGAKSDKEMFSMIDGSYNDGVRYICFTPHFHPGYYGENSEKALASFNIAAEYVKAKYKDLHLYLGNELFYSQDCISWLKEGYYRTVNDTRYVLVDFSEREKCAFIIRGLHSILNCGYIPIFAHAERYSDIKDFEELKRLRQEGVVVQLDTGSVFGNFGFRCKQRAKKMLKSGLIDIVSSDAHDTENRAPGISECYGYISELCGNQYATDICFNNAISILKGNDLERTL